MAKWDAFRAHGTREGSKRRSYARRQDGTEVVYCKGTKSWRVQFRQGFKTAAEAMEWADAAVLDEAAKPAPGGPKTREGWQPIETAPKDGRDFLVWNRENRVRKARWYERSSSDLGISLYEGDGVNSFKGGIQPTHWMPLPAPPEPIVPEVPARVDGAE